MSSFCSPLPPSRCLVGDLISVVCSFLSARDGLLHLRHVSKHWSHYSRLPASWRSSHWEVDSFHHRQLSWARQSESTLEEYLRALSSGMPYLRSLGLPLGEPHASGATAADYSSIAPLLLLDRLVFRNEHVDGALCARLPSLRIVEIADLRGYSRLKVSSADVAAIDAIPSLEAFIAQEHQSKSHDLVAALSHTRTFAQRARALVLPGMDATFDCLHRFARLEELHLHTINGATQSSWLSQAESIRILSIALTSACMDALLAAPAFCARLEYLKLDSGAELISPLKFARLAGLCSALVGLEYAFEFPSTFNYNNTQREPHNAAFVAALTEEKLTEIEASCSDGGASAANQNKDAKRDYVRFVHFLLLPSAFRLRLRSLRLRTIGMEDLDGRSCTYWECAAYPESEAQLLRRFPNLDFARVEEVDPRQRERADTRSTNGWKGTWMIEAPLLSAYVAALKNRAASVISVPAAASSAANPSPKVEKGGEPEAARGVSPLPSYPPLQAIFDHSRRGMYNLGSRCFRVHNIQGDGEGEGHQCPAVTCDAQHEWN